MIVMMMRIIMMRIRMMMSGMMRLMMNCGMISNATGFVSQLLNVDSPAAGSLQCPALLLLCGDEDYEVEDDDDGGEYVTQM